MITPMLERTHPNDGWSDALTCPACGSREVVELRLPENLPMILNGVRTGDVWQQMGEAECLHCRARFEFEVQDDDALV